MPAEIADHAVAVLFGVGLDRVADVADMVAGLGRLDTEHQAFIGHIDKALGLHRHIADEEHAAGVAVPAVQLRRHVDIDNIAVLQFLVRRDAVADDMIDRNTAAMRVAAVAQGGRNPATAHRHFAHDIVQLFGADARHDMRHQRVEYLRRQPSGPAHALETRRAVQFDNPIARNACLSGRDAYILIHLIDIERFSALCEGGICSYADPMTESRIYTAALVIIGDEILSGRTQDKNIGQIALWLNIQGIRLREVRVVADVEESIVEAVNLLRARNDYLFTTGGIGPTHDDITVDAIAAALGVEVVVHPEASAVLHKYYETRGGINPGRLRMARVPAGADLIANKMSGAPGIRVGNIFIMAGVPHITAGMLDALTGQLEGGAPLLSHQVGCWVAESEVAKLLGDTERAHDGCQIGSYPFFKDGKVGANFVVRTTEPAKLNDCVTALIAELKAIGYDSVDGGI